MDESIGATAQRFEGKKVKEKPRKRRAVQRAVDPVIQPMLSA